MKIKKCIFGQFFCHRSKNLQYIKLWVISHGRQYSFMYFSKKLNKSKQCLLRKVPNYEIFDFLDFMLKMWPKYPSGSLLNKYKQFFSYPNNICHIIIIVKIFCGGGVQLFCDSAPPIRSSKPFSQPFECYRLNSENVLMMLCVNDMYYLFEKCTL